MRGSIVQVGARAKREILPFFFRVVLHGVLSSTAPRDSRSNPTNDWRKGVFLLSSITQSSVTVPIMVEEAAVASVAPVKVEGEEQVKGSEGETAATTPAMSVEEAEKECKRQGES